MASYAGGFSSIMIHGDVLHMANAIRNGEYDDLASGKQQHFSMENHNF